MVAEAVPPPRSRYPVSLAVNYPERQSRWKALFRLPLAVPVLLFAYILQSGTVLAIWVTILLRGRIPRWLFDFQVEVNRWLVRALGYMLILTDEYPPFEGDYAIQYAVDCPDRLSRWRLVFWKLITAIPHIVIVYVLWLTALAVTLIGWLAILITGSYPRGLHQYMAGVLRWGARVQAYVLSLTDEFPPFSLGVDAAPSGTRALAASAAAGVLVIAGLAGAAVAWMNTAGQEVTVQVSYQRLMAGEVTAQSTRAHVISVTAGMTGALDPADQLFPVMRPKPAYRFVAFDLAIEITRPGDDVQLKRGQFSLKDASGDRREALLAVVDGRVAPVTLEKHDTAEILLLFELPNNVDPAELRYDAVNYIDGPRVGETIVYKFR